MIRKCLINFAMLALPIAAHAQTTEPASAIATVPAEILSIVKAAYGLQCDFEGEAGPETRYTAFEMAYKDEGDAPDQAAKTATLHEVFCMSGAYNVVTVYLITKSDEGTLPLQFAAPAFRAVYENDDSEKAVLRIDVQGFTTLNVLVNATLDPITGTMTHFSKWRGISDASSAGTWRFLGGQFVLTHFEVDASYDGEINPTVVYDAAPETP